MRGAKAAERSSSAASTVIGIGSLRKVRYSTAAGIERLNHNGRDTRDPRCKGRRTYVNERDVSVASSRIGSARAGIRTAGHRTPPTATRQCGVRRKDHPSATVSRAGWPTVMRSGATDAWSVHGPTMPAKRDVRPAFCDVPHRDLGNRVRQGRLPRRPRPSSSLQRSGCRSSSATRPPSGSSFNKAHGAGPEASAARRAQAEPVCSGTQGIAVHPRQLLAWATTRTLFTGNPTSFGVRCGRDREDVESRVGEQWDLEQELLAAFQRNLTGPGDRYRGGLSDPKVAGSTVICSDISVAGRGLLIRSRRAGVFAVSPLACTIKGGMVSVPSRSEISSI